MATWAEVIALVEAFHTAEGVTKNDPLYRALANRALGEVSARVGHFSGSWSNAATGTITLSGRNVTFPGDLVDATSVYWDDTQIEEASSEEQLDYLDPLWRTSTGTPTIYLRCSYGMLLNREPTGTTTGLLVIYGLGSLPLFDPDETTNPLASLPEAHHFLLADYLIGNLPIELRDKTDAQIAVMREAREKADKRWGNGLDLLIGDMLRRKIAPRKGG